MSEKSEKWVHVAGGRLLRADCVECIRVRAVRPEWWVVELSFAGSEYETPTLKADEVRALLRQLEAEHPLPDYRPPPERLNYDH